MLWNAGGQGEGGLLQPHSRVDPTFPGDSHWPHRGATMPLYGRVRLTSQRLGRVLSFSTELRVGTCNSGGKSSGGKHLLQSQGW